MIASACNKMWRNIRPHSAPTRRHNVKCQANLAGNGLTWHPREAASRITSHDGTIHAATDIVAADCLATARQCLTAHAHEAQRGERNNARKRLKHRLQPHEAEFTEPRAGSPPSIARCTLECKPAALLLEATGSGCPACQTRAPLTSTIWHVALAMRAHMIAR